MSVHVEIPETLPANQFGCGITSHTGVSTESIRIAPAGIFWHTQISTGVILADEKDIIDRFGTDTVFLRDGDTFRTVVRVCVSGNFFGWVFSFGGRVRILSPAHVKKDFENFLYRF